MNNIPVYFSAGGTASLILREIPFTGTAYVILRTVFPESLMDAVNDCVGVCRTMGAKRVFISREDPGDDLPLPHAYDILELTAEKADLPVYDSPYALVPLSEENEISYVKIYNRCFHDVSHAMAYDKSQLTRIRSLGQQAYLVAASGGSFCGIGELHENELAAVALLPEYRGNGQALILQLLSLCPGPTLKITVSSDNTPALRVYGRIGFHEEETESVWYRAE